MLIEILFYPYESIIDLETFVAQSILNNDIKVNTIKK